MSKKIDVNSNNIQVVAITQEAKYVIDSQKKLFSEMYGRTYRDGNQDEENPYVFWNAPKLNKMESQLVSVMRKNGVDEALIYATYKTGYIPVPEEINNYSEEQESEIDFYCDEYNRIINEGTGDVLNLLQFTTLTNNHLSKVYNKCSSYIDSSIYDFMKRHFNSDNDFVKYSIETEMDFLGFCSIKILKDLEGIKFLLENNRVEHIYATCRSIFETYINIVNIAHDRDFFRKNILNNIENNSYLFKKSDDGRVNYTQLILNTTRSKSKVSLRSLAQKSPYKSDILLYDVLYRSACQFIHLDALSSKSYFYESDPFFEVSPSLIGALIGLTCSSLSLEQYSKINITKPIYKKDVKHLTEKIKTQLIESFNLLETDPVNINEMFKVFKLRLSE